jgi:peptide deformylase
MAKSLPIITIPHPTLRQKAYPVQEVDKKLIQFVDNLAQTLDETRNPRGVGLAGPQVDKLWRVFAMNLSTLTTYINPVIVNTSSDQVFGDNADDPDLEGCLSIPHLYGAVPRWQWVELEYSVIEGNTLVAKSERFEGFPARVVQHEVDHLDGILFIDHCLKYQLPIYQHLSSKRDMEEIDPSLLEGI